jgi:hypothetical protein
MVWNGLKWFFARFSRLEQGLVRLLGLGSFCYGLTWSKMVLHGSAGLNKVYLGLVCVCYGLAWSRMGLHGLADFKPMF